LIVAVNIDAVSLVLGSVNVATLVVLGSATLQSLYSARPGRQAAAAAAAQRRRPTQHFSIQSLV
jgi:hypothetical protein